MELAGVGLDVCIQEVIGQRITGAEMNKDWWVSWVQTFLILSSITLYRDHSLSICYLLCAVAVYIHGHWPDRSVDNSKSN
jgi:hypothetical protein